MECGIFVPKPALYQHFPNFCVCKMRDTTKQSFFIYVDLGLIDEHFSFEYRSHTFYSTALQTPKLFLTHPIVLKGKAMDLEKD